MEAYSGSISVDYGSPSARSTALHGISVLVQLFFSPLL